MLIGFDSFICGKHCLHAVKLSIFCLCCNFIRKTKWMLINRRLHNESIKFRWLWFFLHGCGWMWVLNRRRAQWTNDWFVGWSDSRKVFTVPAIIVTQCINGRRVRCFYIYTHIYKHTLFELAAKATNDLPSISVYHSSDSNLM